jgi:hypothetical protein
MGQISFTIQISRFTALRRDISSIMWKGLFLSLVENQWDVSLWGADEEEGGKSNPVSSACRPNVADRVARRDPKATVKEGVAEDSSKPHAEVVGVFPTNRSCCFRSSCSVARLCCRSDRNCKRCVSCDGSARSAWGPAITMPNEAEVKLTSS